MYTLKKMPPMQEFSYTFSSKGVLKSLTKRNQTTFILPKRNPLLYRDVVLNGQLVGHGRPSVDAEREGGPYMPRAHFLHVGFGEMMRNAN